MLEWTDAALVVGGVAAGFVNTLAGGGSALALPLLMLTGLDASQANATNRVAVLLQSTAGAAAFHRRDVRPWGPTAKALPPAIVGAVLGALVAARIPPLAMSRLFGAIFLLLAVLMVAKPRWVVPDPGDTPPHGPTWRGALTLFAVGLYGGVFQAGVGIPLLLVTVRALDLDLVAGNAAKTGLVAVYTLLVVLVFQSQGQIAWGPGLFLAGGAIAGSVLGAQVAIDRGTALVRGIVLVALAAAGVYALVR